MQPEMSPQKTYITPLRGLERPDAIASAIRADDARELAKALRHDDVWAPCAPLAGCATETGGFVPTPFELAVLFGSPRCLALLARRAPPRMAPWHAFCDNDRDSLPRLAVCAAILERQYGAMAWREIGAWLCSEGDVFCLAELQARVESISIEAAIAESHARRRALAL